MRPFEIERPPNSMQVKNALRKDGSPRPKRKPGKNRKKQDLNETRIALINDFDTYYFCDNTISTAKYSVFSFIPLSLFEQYVISPLTFWLYFLCAIPP